MWHILNINCTFKCTWRNAKKKKLFHKKLFFDEMFPFSVFYLFFFCTLLKNFHCKSMFWHHKIESNNLQETWHNWRPLVMMLKVVFSLARSLAPISIPVYQEFLSIALGFCLCLCLNLLELSLSIFLFFFLLRLLLLLIFSPGISFLLVCALFLLFLLRHCGWCCYCCYCCC